MAVNDATARARSTAHDALAFGRRQLDRAVTPETRQGVWDSISEFARERPVLSSFLAAQLLTTLLPLLFFATFALSTLTLALLCALAFALFWSGVALLLVLVPALLVASAAAVLLWLWAAALFLAARSAYRSGLLRRGDPATPAAAADDEHVSRADGGPVGGRSDLAPEEKQGEKQELGGRLLVHDGTETADGENEEPVVKVEETTPVRIYARKNLEG